MALTAFSKRSCVSFSQWIYHRRLLNQADGKVRCLSAYISTEAKPNASPSHRYESVVGLEVHAQIKAKSKLFSGSGTSFVAPVNSQVSFFDAALPGTLPVLNRRCVEAAVLTALALNCTVNKVSLFDRKHYHYADIPAGYQITQQRLPIAINGRFPFIVFNSTEKGPYEMEAKIQQIQLEQDSGKSLHDELENCSLIDLNRAGMALMELVFDANLTNGEEAAALVEELMLILQCLNTCDCKMEEGSVRVDVNVSVNLPGEPWGVRVEIKNIGSVRGVAKATDYEIARQIKVLNDGGKITNETRTFDNKSKLTVAMRDKEMQQDYRFMPEPNLPPLRLSSDENDEGSDPGSVSIPAIREQLPELPGVTRQRVMNDYELTLESAHTLVRTAVLLEYFERVAKVPSRNPKKIFNLIMQDLFKLLNQNNVSLSSCPVEPERLGELYDLSATKLISDETKSDVLAAMFAGDKRSPITIVEENKWQIVPEEEVEKLCDIVIHQHAEKVKQYRNGKTKTFNALLGVVRQLGKNKLNMAIAAKILKHKLNNNK